MADNEFISSVVNNFIGGICVFEVDSESGSVTPVFLNDGIYRMLGGGKTVVDRMLKDIRLSVIPDDLPMFEQGLTDILADDGTAETEFRIVGSDGSLVWLRLTGNLYFREGNKNLISAVILDCTEQKLIEEELKHQSDYLHMLMDTDITFDFNCRTDVCVYRIAHSDELSHDSVINGYLESLPNIGIHEDYEVMFENMIKSAMAHAHRDSMEFESVGIINPTGEYRWYRADIVSIMGKEGYVSHVIGHISDIHEAKLKEFELMLRADHDGLTGLLNKKATEELIERTLEKSSKEGVPCALMILDADNFKGVNDNYGHSEGDHVLSTIGEIIGNNFKGMDVMGRIGGDEFMVLANNITKEDILRLAGRTEKLVMNAFAGKAYEGKISLSIGISLFPEHGTDFASLYKCADAALYKAKEAGKACWKLFE